VNGGTRVGGVWGMTRDGGGPPEMLIGEMAGFRGVGGATAGIFSVREGPFRFTMPPTGGHRLGW